MAYATEHFQIRAIAYILNNVWNASETLDGRYIPNLREKMVKMIFSGIVACLALPAVCAANSAPHIIFILADDLGWADTSLFGSCQIPTPNLDALAAHGLLLNHYYTLQTCTPSRSTLLTGLYAIRLGLQHDVMLATEPGGISLDVPTIAEQMKKLGYDTHALGKWHVGYTSTNYTPTHRGFNTHYGHYNDAKYYFSAKFNFYGICGTDFWDNNSPVTNVEGAYDTHLVTDRAVEIISGHDTRKPMFMYMSTLAVHAQTGHLATDAPERNIAKFPYIGDRNRTLFAGGSVSDLGCVDGIDLWPALLSAKSNKFVEWPRQEFLVNVDQASGLAAYRDGDFKLVEVSNPTSNSSRYPFGAPALQRHVPTAGEAPPLCRSSDAARVYLDSHMKSSITWRTLEKLRSLEDDCAAPWGWRERAAVKCNIGGAVPTYVGLQNGDYLFDLSQDPCELHNLASEMPSVLSKLKDKLQAYRAVARPPKYHTMYKCGLPQVNDCVWASWQDQQQTALQDCPCP
ncbi:arylsulfatase J-like isoform X3 [Dermacentor andersoni]|uniref:arylsulfatase J-like isoform X3 n=1 Tax=Dermacentor andersoni TaxID=34620 RepID=UPI003B3A330A